MPSATAPTRAARALMADLRRRAKTDAAARWLLDLLEKGDSAHADHADAAEEERQDR